MAFMSPPYTMDGTTQDASLFRQAIGSLINGPGIVQAGDLAVTQQATPNMSVLVGVGRVWIAGTSLAAPSPWWPQGLYFSENDAPVTVPISAADPSLPRIDTIIVQVEDAAYAGANKDCKATVVLGTPTAGATLSNLFGVGAAVVSSLILAYVLVPAGAASIVTADIEQTIARALGGLLPLNGNWQALTLASGVGIFPGGYTPSARIEGADVVRLKGAAQNNNAPNITTVATVPAGLRPSSTVVQEPESSSASGPAVAITAAGAIIASGAGVSSGGACFLDGITYTLS